MAISLSSPVSPRDLALKEKRFQSIDDIENAYNIMVRRLNDVYKYNRRDHDRLAEDVEDVEAAVATGAIMTKTTSQSVGLGSTAIIEFNSTIYDPDSWFSGDTYRFTVPTDGLYYASADIGIQHNGQNDTGAQVGVFANGTLYAASRIYTPSTSGYLISRASGLMSLDAGGIVDFRFSHSGGSAMTIVGTGVLQGTQACVFRV